jgi:soluble lytic murein transglycosylase-like protein
LRRAAVFAVALWAAGAADGRAEIALLSSGMTLKVASHRLEGGSARLFLRGGGEVEVPASTVRGFVPDEVVEEVGPPPAGGDLRALSAEVARRHGLDADLVLAVVAVESGFRSEAVSPKGAQGLMQLMPETAAALGVEDALDPEANLEGGTRHLVSLLTLYGGDLPLALAAYNAGAGAVSRYRGVPPYRETREYVKRVLRHYRSEK